MFYLFSQKIDSRRICLEQEVAVRKRTYSLIISHIQLKVLVSIEDIIFTLYSIRKKKKEKKKKREKIIYIHFMLICIDLDVHIYYILLKYNFIDFLFSLNIDALIYVIIREYFIISRIQVMLVNRSSITSI